ncbi:MAG: hypothetical protein A2663_04430 [Candidatus Buchananbacteria bacterium RIFCSPHIGHO2_01_FULL_46_12]|uniref:Uncharacterized protein n=2 Tax=Candidatus Buchananiibacteriota TaxID=1817903 RepID=A0A1G1Y2W2_9BACT|nr:MAG: hypothetical protein A2663_04430 [Candidatus Buchananbacteria bacterium RIFCSPHIGHO2_01_FULL_46_12]OGY52886.1 MAG: hypothetical protein A3B15_01815 [Candidatus Buchananbacteria bacterium RIFCSPLOWO2_01_FULL_45_31]
MIDYFGMIFETANIIRRISMKRFFVLLILFLLVAAPALAGGVTRVEGGIGPRGLALGGAYTAVADDVSAFYYNIAGLSQVEENFVQLGSEIIFPRFSYERPAGIFGAESESKFVNIPMPMAGVIARLNDKLVFGLGSYMPFGLGVSNSESWRPGKNFRKSLLGLGNFTAALAWQATDKLDLGLGLDFGYAQLIYKAPLHQIGEAVFNPAFLKNEGDGFGASFRLGARYRLNSKLTLGLSYSAPLKATLKGKTAVQLWGRPLFEDEFKTHVQFPARLSAGLAWQAGQRLKLVFDADWYPGQPSGLRLDFKHLPTIVQKLDWQTNFSCHLGAEYRLNESWKLRGGLAYLTAAVPEITANPVIPDGLGYGLTFGAGWEKNGWTADAALCYYLADRRVERFTGNLMPGRYQMDGLVVSAAVGRKF